MRLGDYDHALLAFDARRSPSNTFWRDRAVQYDGVVPAWFEQLTCAVPAPEGLAAWAARQPSFDAAWRSCDRFDWMVWLAAATARNDTERRDVVVGGCRIADEAGIFGHMFRLAPSPSERARLWALSSPLDDIDVAVADWFHGILVAASVVVPLAVWMLVHSTTPGAPRSIFLSDLITIPLAVLLTVVGYVACRRIRLRLSRRAASDFADALRATMAAVERRVGRRPDQSASDAQLFRLRMDSVYRYSRAG